MAHLWGESVQSSEDCHPYNDTAQIHSLHEDPPYFCRRQPLDKQEFAYRFKEYNPDDSGRLYPSLTKRVVTASSGTCFKYFEQGRVFDASGNAVYSFFNTTHNLNMSLPLSTEGWSSTLYMYRGINPPDLDEDSSCGSRCKWIWAHRAYGPGLDNQTAWFQCPITISQVSENATDKQQIPDSVARVSAASIALEGRWTPINNGDFNILRANWQQAQFNAYKYVKRHRHLKSFIKED